MVANTSDPINEAVVSYRKGLSARKAGGGHSEHLLYLENMFSDCDVFITISSNSFC